MAAVRVRFRGRVCEPCLVCSVVFAEYKVLYQIDADEALPRGG